MKTTRQFAAVIAALILQLLPAFADDIITNVMSPVVSYQYFDALGTDTNSPFISPVVSYQFYDSLEHAGTNSFIISPIASYQYFDSLDAGSVNFLNSPLVSYFWQFGNSSGPVVLHGRVTNPDGTPISGATLSATVYLAPLAQATTDANGNYQMLSLDAGVYTLWASEASHQTAIRGLTLNAYTASQDFQLKPIPLTPAMQPVNRQPTLPYTYGPMGSALRVFDGTQFVPITASNTPPTDRMTIVLTHGWVQGTPDPAITNATFALWPVDMATAMRANGVTTTLANIVAWDWRYAATDSGLTPSYASDRTPIQGVALGKALLATLGSGYTQPVHFVGHSLGTVVDAAAANYLHGDRTATVRQEVSPTQWSSSRTHMTLLDQAQIAEIAGRQVLFDGLNPTALDAFNAAAGNSPPQNWQSPLPVNYKWADNYVSIVGGTLSGAVNVLLQKGGAVGSPVDAHGYPIQWYIDSITRPAVSTLGFRRSYDYNRVLGTSDADFPPAEVAIGSTYDQAPLSSDPLVLNYFANNSIQPLGIFPDAVVQTLIGAEQYAGNVVSYIVDREITGAQRTWQQVNQGFNYAWDVAAQGEQTVVDFFGSAMLQLKLSTTPAVQLSQQASTHIRGSTPVPINNDAVILPPMVWLPVLIPANSVAMAFDFAISGDPVDDSLVSGIGTNYLFSLPAEYIPTNTISASRLIDVSVWAGKTNELFFGFLGGTSTNATLTIQNIRFYSLQPPQLAIASGGGKVLLNWPSTSGGYVVESTPSLSSPIWETFTNPPAIFGDNYILTNNWSGQTRFFRLRQN